MEMQLLVTDYCIHPTLKLPLLRLFGRDSQGQVHFLHVKGFRPYMYVPAWPGLNLEQLETLTEQLQIRRASIELKTSVWYYHENPSPFVRLELQTPQQVPQVRAWFESNESPMHEPMGTFESDIPFVLRWMVDANVLGGGWIQWPLGSGPVIHCDDIIPLHKKDTLAPLQVVVFDIECMGRNHHFPKARENPVITIGLIKCTLRDKLVIDEQVVITLGTCNQVGTQTFAMRTERDVLLKMVELIQTWDPDILSGYNIIQFDFPYLIERAQVLEMSSRFCLGRIPGEITKVNPDKNISIRGRIILDALLEVKNSVPLCSYSLNSVSQSLLEQQKDDVHYSIIPKLQMGDENDRKRLAEYCLKDSFLVVEILNRLQTIINLVEMGRVTGVPLDLLLSRGQTIKVMAQLLKMARTHAYVLPTHPKIPETDKNSQVAPEKFEGATVLSPQCGFYEDPITTLDFASLYPSIMMAHNLCYTTLLSPSFPRSITLPIYQSPVQHEFVQTIHRQGLLPRILRHLVAERVLTKAKLKEEKDPLRRSVLDARQLVLKLSCNSVYGFTGAPRCSMYCVAISATVTSIGRQMIEITKNKVESHYRIANGFSQDAKVIYGDTDSVMIRFGEKDLAQCMKRGQEAAKQVTALFIPPISLAFEKVYWPYLLVAKKRYAGLYWTRTEKFDKLDIKGLELVRRDNCLLVRETLQQVLNLLMIQRDIGQVKTYVCEVIQDLLQGQIDLSKLVISKTLNKTEYKAKVAHMELTKRKRKRDEASAPIVGDRVPFVIVAGHKHLTCERAEDPLVVLEKRLPIDFKYYLENQFKKPLSRVLLPVLGQEGVHKIFHGEHTRFAVQTRWHPESKMGIRQWTKPLPKCVHCGCVISTPGKAKGLCQKCQEHHADDYATYAYQKQDLEKEAAELKAQCFRCQGSMTHPILCSNFDCPIFYRRHSVVHAINDTQKIIDRLEGGISLTTEQGQTLY